MLPLPKQFINLIITMEKLEIKLNGSEDEILEEIVEIKRYFSSLNIEMKKKNTRNQNSYKEVETWIDICEWVLVLIRIDIHREGLLERHIDLFKDSYAKFVKYYEKAEKRMEEVF